MRTNERWLRLVSERGLAAVEGAQPDPISLIESDHDRQLDLCDMLEEVADSLPGAVSAGLARVAGTTLRQGFPAHIRLEEDTLFPLLRCRGAEHPWLGRVLDQLCHEHTTDESYGHEVAEALDILAETGDAANPDMIGYMLRGFFLTQRRHVEWENAVVLPVARELLTEADLDELCRQILDGPAWHMGLATLSDGQNPRLGIRN